MHTCTYTHMHTYTPNTCTPTHMCHTFQAKKAHLTIPVMTHCWSPWRSTTSYTKVSCLQSQVPQDHHPGGSPSSAITKKVYKHLLPNPTSSNPTSSNPTPSNPTSSNTTSSNPTPSNPTPSNTTPSNPTPSNTTYTQILFTVHPLLTNFNLPYSLNPSSTAVR